MVSENATQSHRNGKTVVIVGLGNIGSHLAALVTRIVGVGRIVAIDPDRYETDNLRCQDIVAADIGFPKVQVQARRLAQVNPSIAVDSIHARVEDVPLGRLRADAIMGGLDSRVARQYVNQAASRLGVPWIDTAVDASGLLARVNVYVPSLNTPCLECTWSEVDYAALEQAYPCQGNSKSVTATNSPASLGAMTAGLAAIECQKLLASDVEHLLAGRQVMLDLRHHTHFVTTFRRNPVCRFDHKTWTVEHIGEPPERLTLLRLTEIASRGGKPGTDWCIQMEGHGFAASQFCSVCEKALPMPVHLARRLSAAERRCPQCGGNMEIRGIDLLSCLAGETLDEQDVNRPLSSFGFQGGDIVTLCGSQGEVHCQVGGPRIDGDGHE